MKDQHIKRFNNIIKRLYEVKSVEDFKAIWKVFYEFDDDLNSYYPLSESDYDGFDGEIEDSGVHDSLINFTVGLELIEEHYNDDQSLVSEGWHFIGQVERYLKSEEDKSPSK